jgi:hypothetical protein
MKFVYSLRDLISVPSLTKSMRRNYQLISTNLLDLFELKSIFSAGVRLLWVGMFVLTAVWTSFVTKSVKDSQVVFLLGFGFHELFFLIPKKGDLINIFGIGQPTLQQKRVRS